MVNFLIDSNVFASSVNFGLHLWVILIEFVTKMLVLEKCDGKA